MSQRQRSRRLISNMLHVFRKSFLILLIAGSILASAQRERLPESVAGDLVIYLFIGHSNMAGQAEPPDTEVHDRAWGDYAADGFCAGGFFGAT